MRFGKNFALIAAATLGFAAAPAQAAVQVTSYAYTPTALGGGIAVDSAGFSEYGAAGRFLSTIQDLASLDSLQRYTFCIDVLTGFATYSPYNIVSASSYFSNAGQASALAGLLTYADSTIAAAGNANASMLSAAAFSLAIWEIVHETAGTYDLAAGNFHVFGDFTSAGSLANSYLANVQSGAWSGNVNNVRVLASANGQSQNQIYLLAGGTGGAVPEPTTWAMLLSGFGIVGAAMRRRNQVTLSFAKA